MLGKNRIVGKNQNVGQKAANKNGVI